jgi:signal transduction histidine kinase
MRSASIRTRLAVLFGATFLVAGLTLVGLNYFLVDTELRNAPEGSREAFAEEFGIELPSFQGRGRGEVIPGALGDLVLEDGRTLREAAESFEARLRSELLNSILVQSLIALAIVAVIAGIAGWLVSRRALDPVAEITQTARTFTEANLSQRVALGGPPDEIKELADTFDAMLDRVERGYANQSNFAAYASHELRTPLSVMRVEADNLLAAADATDGERALATTVQQEVDRSERLISQLLSITRSRSGHLVSETVDLGGLVGEVVAGAVPVADANGIVLELSLGDAEVEGDSSLLRSLIRNLVVNGIVHNTDGGTVTIAVDTDESRPFLTVENSGPVLSDTDVSRMYRPFERIEEDRTSGVGLGLAVVAAISEAHGASIEAVPRPGGGVSTTVRFPDEVQVGRDATA